jgi:DNA-binding transcriptional LysR family regulator
MDRVTSMTTFVEVVNRGGFAPAARALGISPSTVTSHVQSLENRLCIRLLNRSTRRISLTEVGQGYYEQCVRILAALDEAEEVAQAQQATPRGTLRLNISSAIPPFIAPAIAEFAARCPEVTLDMTMTDQMVDLVEQGFDVAIRSAPLADSTLITRRIATYRFVVCAAADYLAARGIPRRPADLAHHNCLLHSHSTGGEVWHFAGPDGEESVHVSGNVISNSAVALRLAALHGQGLHRIPSFLVEDDLRSGQLVTVLNEFLGTEQAIDVFYPNRKYLPAKVRSFVDLLVEYFRDDATHDDATQPPGFASITTQTAAPLRPQARIEAALPRRRAELPSRSRVHESRPPDRRKAIEEPCRSAAGVLRANSRAGRPPKFAVSAGLVHG